MAPIEMIIPNREDVLNDIIAIKKQHEDYGIQLVTKELQKRHPEWNIKDKRGPFRPIDEKNSNNCFL